MAENRGGAPWSTSRRLLMPGGQPSNKVCSVGNGRQRLLGSADEHRVMLQQVARLAALVGGRQPIERNHPGAAQAEAAGPVAAARAHLEQPAVAGQAVQRLIGRDTIGERRHQQGAQGR